MNDLPERIWALECMDGNLWSEPADEFHLYTEYVRADKYAELEADRDKWEQEAGEQHARALSFQKQQERLVELLKTSVAEFDDGIKYPLEVVNDLRSALASMEKE